MVAAIADKTAMQASCKNRKIVAKKSIQANVSVRAHEYAETVKRMTKMQ